MRKYLLLGLALSAALIAGATSPQDTSTPEPTADQLAFDQDQASRMTLPVSIDGKGPYRFLVDTGAERTVISRELAGKLNLQAGPGATMHSVSEVAEVRTVLIPNLRFNTQPMPRINAPALSQANMGAEGMLGVDSLQKQRVLIDFKKGLMTVSPSSAPREKMDRDTIVVTARNQFGRLILADARVDGQKIWVIVDTGAQVSIGNTALRNLLTRRRQIAATQPIEIISVTGGKIMAEYTQVKGVSIGGVQLVNMPIAFADIHPFKKLKLTERPALLLGMDSLSLFERVSVDFAKRKVSFDLPDRSDLHARILLAAR